MHIFFVFVRGIIGQYFYFFIDLVYNFIFPLGENRIIKAMFIAPHVSIITVAPLTMLALA